ncbi:hypothetical protein WT60_19790 [Burkholderia sp. MSMB617WGS]|uniref:Uncharacterized protein n=1 Tax=Burkholderia savannae TaxID=1637837 RepID=A0ABR5T344_9BURK|nr:hypothetical protein WS78_29990 [Burkholderia savannae]AOK49200.1 hypothetical protein WT60_19790 [Burkholderia sp. MSMB617WGS]KVG79635.1 hypothetical protein WS81_14390 [Burkholderia sp. MSMB2040]KVK73757.1 hypothetical protein WS91_20725 [Burkholderia sp. MSMB1498]KWZ37486.1 hypothetical protein WS72_21140 [Burkholderia savannae]
MPRGPEFRLRVSNLHLEFTAFAGVFATPARRRAGTGMPARNPPRAPNRPRAAFPARYFTELALTFAKSRLPKPVS